jgi:hypothetical protein
MKNKLIITGMVSLVILTLMAALLTGCAQEITGSVDIDGNVGIKWEKCNAPAGVSALKTTDNAYVILKWSAPENVSAYEVYYQQEDKKTLVEFGSGQNISIYADDDGAVSANADVDKWSMRIAVSAATFTAGKKYRFGVRSCPLNKWLEYSDIQWAATGYILF